MAGASSVDRPQAVCRAASRYGRIALIPLHEHFPTQTSRPRHRLRVCNRAGFPAGAEPQILKDFDDRQATLLKGVVPNDADLESLAVTLLTLAKRTRALFGLELERSGFSNGQDQLLMALSVDKPLAVGALATTLGVRPSTVSKMLDRLHAKGLLERSTNPRDGRATLVSLTDAGILAQAEIRSIWSGVCRHIAPALAGGAVMTEKQLKDVSNVLAARLLKLR